MFELLNNKELLMLLGTFGISFIFYSLLLQSKKITNPELRSLICIYAKKSPTQALTLGGLPLIASTAVVILFSMFFGEFKSVSLLYWFSSAGIVFTYGYLDDRFEIRPIIKLMFHSLIVFIISFESFSFNSPVSYPLIQFVSFFFIGIMSLNGANLIDGLDTLGSKINVVVYCIFYLIGLHYNIGHVSTLAVISISSLLGFYIFNRVPAKIYLGEMGSCFLGLNSFFLSVTTFKYLNYSQGLSYLESLIVSLLPLAIYCVEVVVSSVRRVLKQTSPFIGDKKHLHHILLFENGIPVQKVSSLLGSIYFVFEVLSLYATLFFHPIAGLLLCLFSFAGLNLVVGVPFWFKDEPRERDTVFIKSSEKRITFIDQAVIDDFDIEEIYQKKQKTSA